VAFSHQAAPFESLHNCDRFELSFVMRLPQRRLQSSNQARSQREQGNSEAFLEDYYRRMKTAVSIIAW